MSNAEESLESSQERPSRETSEVERRGRAALGKLLAAVLVALPGAYAAIRTQYNADADSVRTEVVVRDRQEDAIRRHVEALRREIAAVREAAVTHRDLLELVIKLRERAAIVRPRSPARRAEVSERELELERKLGALRKREKSAVAAKKAVAAAQRKLPALRPSDVVRRAVQMQEPWKSER
jgi:hypothetical protein